MVCWCPYTKSSDTPDFAHEQRSHLDCQDCRYLVTTPWKEYNMASKTQHGKGTGVRRASQWQPVVQDSVRSAMYPAKSAGLIGAIHNTSYQQGLLANQANFANESSFSVTESINGNAKSLNVVGEKACQEYIAVCSEGIISFNSVLDH